MYFIALSQAAFVHARSRRAGGNSQNDTRAELRRCGAGSIKPVHIYDIYIFRKIKMKKFTFMIMLLFSVTGCGNPNVDKIKKASSCENTILKLDNEEKSLIVADGGKSLIGEFPKYKIGDLHCVLDAVNMPDWARADLGATRPIDGRKMAEWDGMVASWSYNGDKVSLTIRIK
jgi:hypothetical protein